MLGARELKASASQMLITFLVNTPQLQASGKRISTHDTMRDELAQPTRRAYLRLVDQPYTVAADNPAQDEQYDGRVHGDLSDGGWNDDWTRSW